MFNFDKKPHDVALDQVISDLLITINAMDETSEDYSIATENLVKLMNLKKENNPSWRPSPDAIVAAASSVLGIIVIVHFEKVGVVTSKALSFVGKMKS